MKRKIYALVFVMILISAFLVFNSCKETEELAEFQTKEQIQQKFKQVTLNKLLSEVKSSPKIVEKLQQNQRS